MIEGQAFPLSWVHIITERYGQKTKQYCHTKGMSLDDYMMAHVLQGLCANPNINPLRAAELAREIVDSLERK